jgi:hypothetical protein
MTINSVTVRVSDGIKTADYAPPKLYDLTAIVESPAADDLDKTIDMLVAAGDRFLGRKPATVQTTIHQTADEAAPAAAAKKTRAKPADKAPVKDPMAVEEEATGHPGPAPSTQGPAKADPMAIDDDLGGEADDWETGGEEVVEEITDDDLNKATQQKNSTLGDPKKIRDLINSYNPDKTKTFQLRQIPADKRGEYLTKLKALA